MPSLTHYARSMHSPFAGCGGYHNGNASGLRHEVTCPQCLAVLRAYDNAPVPKPKSPSVTEPTQHWMTARYPGRCSECNLVICSGDRIVWDKTERKTYCNEHGVDIVGADPMDGVNNG